MHLKSLKVFCDVVSRRSFSRAATENGISQSGASQIVNALEEHLGVKLIDRTKRPFVLTPEGDAYYEGCRKLVQRYFALEEEVRTLHEEVAGRVSVASIYSIGLSHMNRFVQRFLQAYPKANVRVQYQHPDRVYELVESNQVDFGLVSFPHSSRTIKATVWRQEPMVLVCSLGHRLAERRVVLRDADPAVDRLRRRRRADVLDLGHGKGGVAELGPDDLLADPGGVLALQADPVHPPEDPHQHEPGRQGGQRDQEAEPGAEVGGEDQVDAAHEDGRADDDDGDAADLGLPADGEQGGEAQHHRLRM
jgi:DNA-binding transcriptional LysR family regulator